MRNLVFVAFILLTFLSHFGISFAYEKEIKSISSTITENVTKAGKKTVAVVDFTDLQGNVTKLGRFLAEELSVNLTIMAKGFEIIDRTHLKSILTEHKLSMSGLVDPKTVKQLGKIAGVDAIVTGSITPFGDSIRVSAKVIGTDTARVIGASSGDIAKTKAIEELMVRGIETAVAPTPGLVEPTPTPTRPKAIQKVESNKFTFELRECKISGGSVTCDILITNNAEDREMSLYAGRTWGQATSRLFDDHGNVHIAEEARIANSRGHMASILLVSGVPVKAGLTFVNVSSEAKAIALLELSCHNFRVQLRNIPLSR